VTPGGRRAGGLRRWLAGLCGILAAIVAAELILPVAAPPTAGTGGSRPLPPPPPAPGLAPAPESAFAVVLERPVFSPWRRPAPAPAAGEVTAAAGQVRVVGIVIAGEDRMALVQLGDGDPPRPVRQGQEIGGWVAISIASDRVLFRHDGAEQEIGLDYRAAPPAAPPRPTRRPARPQPPATGPAEPPPAAGQLVTPPEPAGQ
jgi:hypothetical protein